MNRRNIAPKRRRLDAARFVAIVDESRNIFQGRYGGKFRLVLWWETETEAQRQDLSILKTLLDQKKIPYTLIQQAIPDYAENATKYKINHDGHPNALAQFLLAKYLLKLK